MKLTKLHKIKKSHFIFALFIVFLLVINSVKNTSAKPSVDKPTVTLNTQEYVSNEILVKFKPGTPANIKAKIHQNQNVMFVNTIPGIDVDVVRFSNSTALEKVSAYSKNPNVQFAEPNYYARATEIDPFFQNQWGLNNTGQVYKQGLSGIPDADIDAPEAWNTQIGSSAVVIAILDSGIDTNHIDLEKKVIGYFDFTGNGIEDNYGHGTHVAGIAAADTYNSIGVAGIGYNSKLLSVKVLNNDGYGAHSWIANGIIFAADKFKDGVKVINLSLGGSKKSDTLKAAIDYAWERGLVIVAAAGNSANPSPTYPAYYDNVLSVAATDSNDEKADFSSYGSWVDVAAPGVDIFSTFPNHEFKIQDIYNRSLNYDYANGTSMSTPFVSGIAALLWATGNYNSNSDIVARIQQTAENISGTGSYWIYGRVNACLAIGGNCNPVLPSPTFVPSPSPSFSPDPSEEPTPEPSETPTPEPTSTPTPEPSEPPNPLCGACFKGICDGKCHPKEVGTECPDCS